MMRFCAAFLLSGIVPLLWLWNPVAPALILPLVVILLLGAELLAPARRGAQGPTTRSPAHRLVPLLYIPAQLALIVWGIAVSVHAGAWTIAALALAIGMTTGIFGMLAAHEMVHSRSRLEQMWGTLMLTGMFYRHFRIAHVYGHHRYAATERDPATARLGEAFYAFLLRTLCGQFMDAWRFEEMRLHNRPRAWLHNRVGRDLMVYVAIAAAVAAAAGLRGIAFLAAQSAVAISMLEMFNYVAHYGLIRERKAGGALEPFSPRHSWNCGNVLANAIVFNMGRHSDHHARPASPYQALRRIDDGPELPGGYAGAMLLALVPPLWRRVMDAKAAALREHVPA